SIYMAAVQAMTQRGGWPMTVFLTPDGVPFYGGTYYPPEDRMGMPGFPRVLLGVAQAYATRRDEVVQSGRQLTAYLQQLGAPPPAEGEPSAAMLAQAASTIGHRFDAAEGGFGAAPKFPQPMVLDFLLRMHRRTEEPSLLEMVELTLSKMARGGMYDQLGGGFHRYSTDSRWLVPHFEKMLYDNAQLASVYLHAFQVTGRPFYRQVVEQTLDYVVREMASPEGGFYSTQDADSEGEEGKFFVWTADELEALVGPGDARLFGRYYDVTPAGNWEGKNILHAAGTASQLESEFGLQPEELAASLERSRQRLLAVRERRIRPGRDEKILTSWNGLMLKAFAEASAILGRPDYARVAQRNARFLLGQLRSGGRILRTYKDGRGKLNGYLEDYASLIDGLLALYQATFEADWHVAARGLADAMVEQFWEPADASFYDTPRDHEALIARPRDLYDNATPSGNSVAVEDLVRLALLTGEQRYRDIAARVLAGTLEPAAGYPLGFGRLLAAADLYLGPAKEIAIVGPPEAAAVAGLREAFWSIYTPNAVLAGGPEAAADSSVPLLVNRPLLNGRPAAYVCEGWVCRAPVTEPSALVEELRTSR
ncbi:MAG: thioredoxin domain-containing protein, partial [Chloroflexota bacterium]|nr:thioredoxin domain-containing protein [Chloroflexota bacterium]